MFLARLTGERLIRILSVAIALTFLFFAITAVFVEFSKPSDPVGRIVAEQCDTLSICGTPSFTTPHKQDVEQCTLSSILAGNNRCVAISFSSLPTEDAHKLRMRAPIRGWDYLYLSDKDAVLTRFSQNFQPFADALRTCLKKNECETDGLKGRSSIVPFTVALFSGNDTTPVISLTVREFAFFSAVSHARSALLAMAAARHIDVNNPDFFLRIYFHKKDTLLAKKDALWIAPRFHRGFDGFYLESRGAKLRAMPWEMNNSRPLLHAIKRKGYQYGLRKQELKEASAKLYLFSTVPFKEKRGKMIEKH